MTKHKTLGTPSAILLNKFNETDKQFFTIADASAILKDSSDDTLRKLLSIMVERGLLMRIRNGLYHIIPYDKDPKTYQPDWHLTAMHLIDTNNFYIGYFSALSIYNLTTQPLLKEQIVINKKNEKKIISVKNIEFELIYHNKKHFFGAKNIWIDNFTKVKCSDLEKTIIDCLFIPMHGGGITEIAKAIYKSKDKINFKKLYDYLIKFDSQAVIKRLGYLLELLGIKNPIIEKLLKLKTNSFVPLDPSLNSDGKILTRWSVQQNMDIETIKSSMKN
ncbi:MAG: type IV toxin-antitoxin system AbiEi family antitoxin [Bacteroidales bacterium]|jgi:predicted transcriptional regulator of viral defense system